MPSGRWRTVPVTRTTHSPRSACAAACASAASLGVEHDLDHAFAVAQVDERHAAVVAPVGHPPAERDLRARVARRGARRTGACASRSAASVTANALRRAVSHPRGRRPAPSPARRRPCRRSVTVRRRARARPRIAANVRAAAVGDLELRLERALLERHVRGDAPRRGAPRPSPGRDRARPRRSRRRRRRPRPPPAARRPSAAIARSTRSKPHPEPHARHVRPAERLGQPVVTPAAEQGPLLRGQPRPRRTRTRSSCSSRARGRASGSSAGSIPAAPSPARTASKCAAQASQRWSVILGASAATRRHASSLQSSTRIGLSPNRSRCSSVSSSRWPSKYASRISRYAGRQVASPIELTSTS